MEISSTIFLKKFHWIAFLFLFFSPLASFGQTFNFKNYTINDGLPQSYIYSIVQSPRGRIWIGTGEGLASFDGKKFNIYTTSEGLAENFVTSSLHDRDGNLWFGHYQGGITLYNGNNFTAIKHTQQVTSPINCIYQDRIGNIWFGTQSNGLVKIDVDKKISYLLEDKLRSVNCINEDSEGNLYISTSTQLLKIPAENPEKSVPTILLDEINIQKAILKHDKKGIWIGTKDEGLFEYNFSNSSVATPVKGNHEFLGKQINILYNDEDDNLWIGAFGQGITKYKITKGNEFIKTDIYHTTTGLSNNYIKSFFKDREGNFWMGTFGGGLDLLLDPVFTLYTTADGLINPNVTSIYHDSKDNIWVGTPDGINRFKSTGFKNSNEIVHYCIKNGIPADQKITAIQEDSLGNILIGTTDEGIMLFDPKAEKCKKWFFHDENKLINKINHISKDKDNNIWVATEGGVFIIDHVTGERIHLTMEDGILHNNIFSIYIDSKNTAWLATHGTGLTSYKNGKVINYFSPNESTGLDINCFTEDKDGNLWVGTYGQGVFIFDGKKFLRKYTQNDGLASNYCYLMTKDLNNNIWIGHKTGISKYESIKRSFSIYKKNSGFLADEVNSNSVGVDNAGNIWFGTSTGLLKYNIKTDKPNLIGPIVNITDLRLFYQHTDWSQYSDSLIGFAKMPYQLDLPYNKNHLTFNVIGISLSSPEKIKYQYKLDGFEKEWSLLTNTDFVTYSNLPPGEYTFKAKAQNSYGTWSEIPATYKFKIIAPFWKTPWFISLACLCGIIFISAIISVRTKSLKRQQLKLQDEKNRLEVEIKHRKRAQKKQKISEEKLKKTNQELNTFIYRASHDLRGPLSTVKGLTQLGIMEVKEEKSLKYFNLISDRISRLDSILKDLIYIVEVTDVTIHSQKIDFNAIINSSIEVLKEIYPLKNLNFILNISLTKDFYNDYNIIFTTFKNLIDNSIKYTNPEKEVSDIEVTVKTYQTGVKICVIDNGIGIQQEVQGKIFDMFFRGTDQSKGSGLGLYLIKKIVDKLEGEIKVESVYLKGTRMEIFFPSYYQMPVEDKVIKSKNT